MDYISREDNIKPTELYLTDRYLNVGWYPDDDDDEEVIIDEQTLEWMKRLEGWEITTSPQVCPFDSDLVTKADVITV